MLTTVCFGNIPMLLMMMWFWVYLQYATGVVIIAFIASFTCLIVSFLFILVPSLKYWSFKELPFALSIRWSINGRADSQSDPLDDPMRKTGNRRILAKELTRILEFSKIEIQFLSSIRHNSGCIVYGVIVLPKHLKWPSFDNTTVCTLRLKKKMFFKILAFEI